MPFTVGTLADIEGACARPTRAPTPCWRTSRVGPGKHRHHPVRRGTHGDRAHPAPQQSQHSGPGIRAAPDQPPSLVSGAHRRIVAGIRAAHHRPPRQTPQHLGRLKRRPRPARRLARAGLASAGRVAHEPPSGVLPLDRWTRSRDQLTGHMPLARYLVSWYFSQPG